MHRAIFWVSQHPARDPGEFDSTVFHQMCKELAPVSPELGTRRPLRAVLAVKRIRRTAAKSDPAC